MIRSRCLGQCFELFLEISLDKILLCNIEQLLIIKLKQGEITLPNWNFTNRFNWTDKKWKDIHLYYVWFHRLEHNLLDFYYFLEYNQECPFENVRGRNVFDFSTFHIYMRGRKYLGHSRHYLSLSEVDIANNIRQFSQYSFGDIQTICMFFVWIIIKIENNHKRNERKYVYTKSVLPSHCYILYVLELYKLKFPRSIKRLSFLLYVLYRYR